MKKSIEINTNQTLADSGIEINASGTEATGIVEAVISYKTETAFAWGFKLKLGFLADLKKNKDNSAGVVVSYLEVTKALLWQNNTNNTKNDGDYVSYTLDEEERNTVILMLVDAVKEHIANSDKDSAILLNSPAAKGKKTMMFKTIKEGFWSLPRAKTHMDIDLSSKDNFITDNYEAFSGAATVLLNESIEFFVSFNGYYDETYHAAEYFGGVLMKPKIAKTSNFSMERVRFSSFKDASTGKYLPEFLLSNSDANLFKEKIYHQVRMLHTQRNFPLGESSQLSV